MDLKETGYEEVNRVHLAQDGDQWRDHANELLSFINGKQLLD
jgi:hypothetical protein